MNGEKRNIAGFVKQVVQRLYKGEIEKVLQYCETELAWIIVSYQNERLLSWEDLRCFSGKMSEEVQEIIHLEYQVVCQTSIISVVTGSYCIQKSQKDGNKEALNQDITMVLQMGSRGLKIKHVHISAWQQKHRHYKIRSIHETFHYLKEEEIIYLEAMHNHVIWHCAGRTLETVSSLKKEEEILSDAFLRIHKGYIIQKGHVAGVGRCYVKMDSGDILQVPEKKYCDVKRKLGLL